MTDNATLAATVDCVRCGIIYMTAAEFERLPVFGGNKHCPVCRRPVLATPPTKKDVRNET